jgi:serine/threonine-protein kinase
MLVLFHLANRHTYGNHQRKTPFHQLLILGCLTNILGEHYMKINNEEEKEIATIFSCLNDDYKLLDKIGKGGQKRVYKIINGSGEVQVLKIFFVSDNTGERVKREIHASKIIDHPQIPQILMSNVETNTSDNFIWIIEEFIDGQSLREIFASKKKFTIRDIITFLDTMLSILEKSEEKNIIHRDIKPENILFDIDQKYWLIDFGIARHLDLISLTDTNAPFGLFTIGYSASEQFRNRKYDIDIRADLFSLGVVSAEMILGYNPYVKDADNILTIIHNIEKAPLPILRIEGDTRYLLAQFLKILGDNRTSRRPSSAREAIELFNIVKSTLSI